MIIKSPTKLFSPFSAHSIQTTISSSEIDQTIDEVINGKGDINVSDLPQAPPQPQLQPPPLPQPQQHPSSQLVWVQNGTVTTKTWLSPLYQKQQQQQQQQQQQFNIDASGCGEHCSTGRLSNDERTKQRLEDNRCRH
jgi:hypothetical protein